MFLLALPKMNGLQTRFFFSFFPPKCPFVSQVAKKLLIWEEAEIADVV